MVWLPIQGEKVLMSMGSMGALSRKFWSGENFGPGDQNSWKISPPDHNFPKNFVGAWNNGPSAGTWGSEQFNDIILC